MRITSFPVPIALSALAIGFLLVQAAPVLAQLGDNQSAGVGFFLTEPRGRRACEIDPPACEDDLLTGGELFLPYYAYLCVFKGDPELGIAGVQLGIDYDGSGGSGVDLDWHLCADLEFSDPRWPQPRSGNTITWDGGNNCQNLEPGGFGTGVTAIAGYFYLTAYSDDELRVVANPAVNGLWVAACNAAGRQIDLDKAGFVAFSEDGSAQGKKPCKTIQTEDATWGAIKNQYNDGR